MKYGYLLSSNCIQLHDIGYNKHRGDRHVYFNTYQAGTEAAEGKKDGS